MSRVAPLLLWLLVVAGVAIVLGTSSALPPQVATHFGAGGHADGWMSRIAYEVFYASMMIGIAFAVYAAFSWLPRRKPHLLNLPNREYWLAAPRRDAALAALRLFGVALAMAIVGLLVTLHVLVLEANARTPPRIDEGAILVLLAGFAALVVTFVVLLYVRFRRP